MIVGSFALLLALDLVSRRGQDQVHRRLAALAVALAQLIGTGDRLREKIPLDGHRRVPVAPAIVSLQAGIGERGAKVADTDVPLVFVEIFRREVSITRDRRIEFGRKALDQPVSADLGDAGFVGAKARLRVEADCFVFRDDDW